MGTRCDFYIGRGVDAEWLGSVAWDGHPECFEPLLSATTVEEFKLRMQAAVYHREDFTSPDKGWPWPWEDSRTTDYAIAFDDGKVYASCFGRAWYDPRNPPEDETAGKKVAVFPNMKTKQKVAVDGARSGLLTVEIIMPKGRKL